tara:strand:+ start:11106 stop:13451 length:2346 start_codon:yes stop_codon:yes gene_type:complete
MATESSYTRIEQLPPNMLAQLFSGVQGQNIPGIMPLLNQELVNRMMGFGVEGANPYTYSGQRIAGFSPAEQEAFRMTAQGMGSYLPFFQDAERMTKGGLDISADAYRDAAGRINQAVQAGEMSTQEAQQLLSRVPGIAQSYTDQGFAQLGGAGDELTGARLASERGIGAFDPASISQFYDPYEDQVVGQVMEDVREGLAQGDISRRAQAIGSGAFGGSRSRLMGEELAESAARGAAKQIGDIRSRGFADAANRAQGAFESQQGRQIGQAGLLGQLAGQRAGLGGAMAGMGGNLAGIYGNVAGGLGSLGGNLANIYGQAGRDIYGAGSNLGRLGMGAGQLMSGYGQGISGLLGQDINRMMGMGGLQRGMDQRALDLAYGNFVGNYNLPLQTLGQIGGMAAGFAPALGQTTLQSGQAGNTSNPLMQMLGTGMQAYGMFNGNTGGGSGTPTTVTGGQGPISAPGKGGPPQVDLRYSGGQQGAVPLPNPTPPTTGQGMPPVPGQGMPDMNLGSSYKLGGPNALPIPMQFGGSVIDQNTAVPVPPTTQPIGAPVPRQGMPDMNLGSSYKLGGPNAIPPMTTGQGMPPQMDLKYSGGQQGAVPLPSQTTVTPGEYGTRPIDGSYQQPINYVGDWGPGGQPVPPKIGQPITQPGGPGQIAPPGKPITPPTLLPPPPGSVVAPTPTDWNPTPSGPIRTTIGGQSGAYGGGPSLPIVPMTGTAQPISNPVQNPIGGTPPPPNFDDYLDFYRNPPIGQPISPIPVGGQGIGSMSSSIPITPRRSGFFSRMS